MLERRVVLGQFGRVQVDQLGEEQVQQHPRIGEPVRWDADIDRHALPAHVRHREVIAARGRIHQRIAEDRQRCVERGQDARQRVVAGGEKAHQGINAGVRQRTLRMRTALHALLHQALQMLLDGLTLAARLPQDFPDSARQLRCLDQVQGEAEEQVARRVVEESFGAAALHIRGVQDLCDGQRVADDVAIGEPDRAERVPAVRAAVFGEGRPRIDGLAVRRPKPCRDRPVLRLDVDDHGAVLPCK